MFSVLELILIRNTQRISKITCQDNEHQRLVKGHTSQVKRRGYKIIWMNFTLGLIGYVF